MRFCGKHGGAGDGGGRHGRGDGRGGRGGLVKLIMGNCSIQQDIALCQK